MKSKKKKTRKFLMALSTSLLLLAMSACSGQGGKEASTAENDNTLRIGMDGDVLTFDTQDNGAFGTPMMNIFNTLVKIDDEGNFHPHIAKEYKTVNDVTWQFTLNEGVKFHNGEDLTADDVKFTLERVVKDNTLIEHERFKTIKEVRIIDDYNIQIITHKPDPSMLNRLIRMGAAILPEDYINEHGMEYFVEHPIGSGPYKVASYQRDNEMVLDKFDEYFKGDISDWDKVIIRTLPGASTRVNELVTGGVDIVNDIPPAEWPRINDNKGTKIITAPSTQVLLLISNQNKGFATADPKIRKAIDFAINDKAIIDNLFKGYGTPTRTHITPGVSGLNEKVYDNYLYDVDKAKQLLKEAGYGKGKPLKLTFQVPQGRYLMDSELGQMISGMLKEAGIQVDLQLLENSKFVEVRNNGNNQELMLSGQGNSMFDPFLPLDAFHSETYPERIGYKNQKVDQLLDTAEHNMNIEERMEQYKEVQEIVAEELPYIYIYNEEYFTGVNSNKVDMKPRVDKDIIIEEIKKK
jgi:peptide/nickel transport system substrate-binding protein